MSTIISGDGTITGLTSTGISAVQNLPAGSILQVQQAVVTAASASINSSTQADISGMSVTITPKNSSSNF